MIHRSNHSHDTHLAGPSFLINADGVRVPSLAAAEIRLNAFPHAGSLSTSRFKSASDERVSSRPSSPTLTPSSLAIAARNASFGYRRPASISAMNEDEMPVRLANSLMEKPMPLRSSRTFSPSECVCIRLRTAWKSIPWGQGQSMTLSREKPNTGPTHGQISGRRVVGRRHRNGSLTPAQSRRRRNIPFSCWRPGGGFLRTHLPSHPSPSAQIH